MNRTLTQSPSFWLQWCWALLLTLVTSSSQSSISSRKCYGRHHEQYSGYFMCFYFAKTTRQETPFSGKCIERKCTVLRTNFVLETGMTMAESREAERAPTRKLVGVCSRHTKHTSRAGYGCLVLIHSSSHYLQSLPTFLDIVHLLPV